jgi:hypothetical protein
MEIITVAFLVVVICIAVLTKAHLKERASNRQKMTDNAMRSMGN